MLLRTHSKTLSLKQHGGKQPLSGHHVHERQVTPENTYPGVTSLSLCLSSKSMSQRGEIVESTAALYGRVNLPTHRHRGNADDFCCCILLLDEQRGVIVEH